MVIMVEGGFSLNFYRVMSCILAEPRLAEDLPLDSEKDRAAC